MSGSLSEWTQEIEGDEPWWWASGDRHGLPRVVVVRKTTRRDRLGRPSFVAFITDWIGDRRTDARRAFLVTADGNAPRGIAMLDAGPDIERLLDDVQAYMVGV